MFFDLIFYITELRPSSLLWLFFQADIDILLNHKDSNLDGSWQRWPSYGLSWFWQIINRKGIKKPVTEVSDSFCPYHWNKMVDVQAKLLTDAEKESFRTIRLKPVSKWQGPWGPLKGENLPQWLYKWFDKSLLLLF